MISESLNCIGIVLSFMIEKRENLPDIVSIIASFVGGLISDI